MEGLKLKRMNSKEFHVYYTQAVESYADELLRSGRFPDAQQAQEFALWEYQDIFSKGYETPNTDVYHICIGEKRAGMKSMRLGVFKNNTVARKLYEKLGYAVVRDREADLMMEKSLDA